jgi:hypothetical protein
LSSLTRSTRGWAVLRAGVKGMRGDYHTAGGRG